MNWENLSVTNFSPGKRCHSSTPSRNITIHDSFAFPLGAVPLVFAEIDGTLKKTPKSALLHKLEANISPVEDFPLNSAMIIDGMALVRQIKTSKMTFK